MLKYSYLNEPRVLLFVRSFLFCFVFLLSNVHWSACRTVIGQIYDSSFALLSYGDSLARFDGCSIALHDVRWLASFDDCLIDNASSQIGWGVTSLSLVIRRKTPLPPFQPIKSQARKNCNNFRWICDTFFPRLLVLAISSMHSLSDRLLCLLCLYFAILSFPAKNKNGLCDIAITHARLSIVLYEFLLSILNTKLNSM